MATPILLLWDIDGTLIRTGGAGESALVRATRTVLGADLDLHQLDWPGRTDRRIAEMILEHLGHPVTAEKTGELLEAYLEYLPEELSPHEGVVLPGIAAIVRNVDADESLAQGLLTGNMERGARTKLTHVDLWRYFPFGAFADDSVDRNDLAPHALRKAAAFHGREFSPESTYVIGDTPHDIACGQVVGARTIAVATGKHSEDALRERGPTALLRNLADPAAFFDLLDRN